jgi:hypothetical protein
MTIQPYKLINSSESAVLTARLLEGVARWVAQYALEETAARCTLETYGEPLPQAHEWVMGVRPSGPVLALGLPEDWPRQLAGLVLPERQAVALDPAGVRLMQELGVGLLEDLGRSVIDSVLTKRSDADLVWSRTAAPRSEPRPENSFVLCRCQLGAGMELRIALWPATVLACLSPAVPRPAVGSLVEPVSRALQAQVVVLDGIVGEAELAVEELSTLAVGDVIRLNRKFSEPLQVRLSGGAVVCAARLGALKGRTAVQLS